MSQLFAIGGMMAGTGGVALLYLSWSGRLQQKKWVLIPAWTSIALSFWLWSLAAGAEFGSVIAALQLSLAAWIFVLANPRVRNNQGRRQPPARVTLPRLQEIAWHAGRVCLTVPLAAIASTTIVLAAVTLLPWADVDRLAMAVLLIPLVWGLLVYWTLLEARLWRPAFWIAAGGALGLTVLYL